MHINTRFFSEVEIEEEKILTFQSGLIGMVGLKRFVVIEDETISPCLWIQSLDDLDILLLAMAPRIFRPGYTVMVHQQEVTQWGMRAAADIEVLCLLTQSKETQTLTANLQGPLLIDGKNRVGKQIMLMDAQVQSCHNVLDEMRGVGRAENGLPPGPVLQIKNP